MQFYPYIAWSFFIKTTAMRFLLILGLFCFSTLLYAQNEVPFLTNISIEEDEDEGLIYLRYDLNDAEGDPCSVSVFYSPPGRTAHPVLLNNLTGAVGQNILPGSGKTIVWEYDQPLTGGQHSFKVVAEDGQSWTVNEVLDAIAVDQLKSNLEFVVGPRHRQSNPIHLANVQDSLQHLFESQGWELDIQEWSFGNYQAKNYIGKLPGTTADTVWILLGGHYDSVAGSPGADDNGTATSAVMEAARLLSQYRFRKTIRIIAFDLEEEGLVGSGRYVTQMLPQDETLEGFLDWEMIGYYRDDPNSQSVPFGFSVLFPQAYQALESDSFKGNFLTNVGNDVSQELLEAFEDAAATYVPELRVISVQVPGQGTSVPDLLRSDHAPFWISGEKALMLTDGANFRNPNYHQGTDVIDSVDFNFMEQVFRASIATAVELAELHHAGQASIELSKIVGTKEVSVPLFQVSPNPVRQTLWLYPETTIKEVWLYDAQGKLMFNRQGKIRNTLGIDMSAFPEGMYWLQVSDGETFATEKVLKLR
jgi:hypothetical protein